MTITTSKDNDPLTGIIHAQVYPVLELKRMGLSKACRRLVVTLMRRYSADIIHFDASGEVLPGFTTFDW